MENKKLIEELQSIKDELLEKARNDEKTQITTQEMLVDIDIIYSILNEHIKALEKD